MLEAVEKNGVELTVAFVSRFAQEAERAKKIVDNGTIGDVVSARAVIGLAGISEIGCPSEMADWMEKEFVPMLLEEAAPVGIRRIPPQLPKDTGPLQEIDL